MKDLYDEELQCADTFMLISEDNRGMRTLDLMRLSEVFSRAGAVAMEAPQLSGMFNDFAMRLSRQLSTAPHDINAAKKARNIMTDMILAAREHGVDRVIMPIHRKNGIAEFFMSNVLEGSSFENHYHVGVEFIDDDYKLERRVKRLGERRAEAHTALHYKFDKPAL